MRKFEIAKHQFILQDDFRWLRNDIVSGSTGRRSVEVDDFLELQIPLPPLEVQNEIVVKIEKQKQIIEGAEQIEQGFHIPAFLTDNFPKVPFGPYVNIVTGKIDANNATEDGQYPFFTCASAL